MLQRTPASQPPSHTEPALTPNLEELKKALEPVREARLARAALSSPVRLTPPRPSREEVEPLIAKTRLDPAEVDRLVTKYRAEQRSLADRQKRTALEQSAELQAFLGAGVTARRKAAEYFAGLLPTSRRYVVDRPFLIWPSRGLQVDDYQTQPYHSWAKLKHRATSGNGLGELTFYYLWQNPVDADTAVVNADAYLVLNGFCEADDTTGWWLLDHSPTTLSLSVQLEVFNWSRDQQNPAAQTLPLSALDLQAYGPGGWPVSVGALLSQNVFRGYDLQLQNLLIARDEVMVFEVIMQLQYTIDDGSVEVDFSSGDYQIGSPFVQVTVTSQ